MSYPAPPAPAAAERQVTGQLAGLEQRNAGWMRFLIMEPGNQYPTKADTKRPELVQQATSLIGQQVTAMVKEEPSTTLNPHTQQPYTNRYLNAIALAGQTPGVTPPQGQPGGGSEYHPGYASVPGMVPAQTPPQAAPQPAQQQYVPPQPQAPPPAPAQPVAPPIQPGISGFDRDMNIMRQTASKVVTNMLMAGQIPVDQITPAGLVAACETWLAYYVHGPLRFGVQAFSTPAPQQQVAPQPSDAAPATWGGNDPGREQGDPGSDDIPF